MFKHRFGMGGCLFIGEMSGRLLGLVFIVLLINLSNMHVRTALPGAPVIDD